MLCVVALKYLIMFRRSALEQDLNLSISHNGTKKFYYFFFVRFVFLWLNYNIE